jgi:serine/threonine-protein kinase
VRSAPTTHSRLPLFAILAIAAVLVGGALGLALSKGGGSSDNKRASSGRAATQTSARGSSKPKASAPATPQPPAAPPPATAPKTTTKPAAAGGSDPVALNARGFALSNAGNYAAAVAPLQQSVQAFRDAGRTDELDFYFALFNLGKALNRSGNPAEAIPILQERLRNPNQQGTVKKELAAAQAALGGGSKKPKPGKAKGNGEG